MKNRIFSLLLAAVLFVGLFAGCGGKVEAPMENSTDRPPVTAPQNETAPSVPTETAAEGSAPAAQEMGTETIERTVLLDEQGLKITAESLYFSSFVEIEFDIENKTGKELSIDLDQVTVNGGMVEASSEGEAGNETHSGYAVIYITRDSLERYQPQPIYEITMAFVFEDENDEVYLHTDRLSIKTSAAKTGAPVFSDMKTLLYDANDVKIWVNDMIGNDGEQSPYLEMMVVNDRDTELSISQTGDPGLNRYSKEGRLRGCTEILPHCRSAFRLIYVRRELEERRIGIINEIISGFELKEADGGATIDVIAPTVIWKNPEPGRDVPYDEDTSTVLFDENGVKVVALGFERDESDNLIMRYYMENYVDTYNVMSMSYLSAEGWMIGRFDTIETEYIGANRRMFGSLYVPKTDLSLCGLDRVSEITFSLYVSSKEDDTVYCRLRDISLPTGETGTGSTLDLDGYVCYDANQIKIISTGPARREAYSSYANLPVIIINNGDMDINLVELGGDVNDVHVSWVAGVTVRAGKARVKEYTFGDAFEKKYQLEDVDQVTIKWIIRALPGDGKDAITIEALKEYTVWKR